MISKNKIVAYSLLAHINDHNKGINDFSDIFVPLIKRVLSQLNTKGLKKGLLSDLKKEIDIFYNFDIPYPLLAHMLNKIELEFSKDDSVEFKVHSDNSFQMSNFCFYEFEETIKESEYEIKKLDLLYNNFLKSRNLDPNTEKSIYEFIDSNRLELSRYFVNPSIVQESSQLYDFSLQAKFISTLAEDKKTFDTLKRIYLGSIISSYLELDSIKLETKNIELLLDTSFIISLYGLSSSESEHTCNKIIELGNKFGYNFTTFSLTFQEAYNLILRISSQISTSFFGSITISV